MADALYGTPDDYVPNASIPQAGVAAYWTRERVVASARFQYAVYERVHRLAHELRATSVVDIGCGTAMKLQRFFGHLSVFGVDSEEAVKVARTICPRGRFAAADLDGELDFDALLPGCSKDLVVCADVIEHLAHPERVLAAIHRFAASHTYIVISTPDRRGLVGRDACAPSVPEHVREWSLTELTGFLTRSGFSVIDQQLTYPFRFGIDRMTARFFASRLRHRLPLRTNQVVTCRVA